VLEEVGQSYGTVVMRCQTHTGVARRRPMCRGHRVLGVHPAMKRNQLAILQKQAKGSWPLGMHAAFVWPRSMAQCAVRTQHCGICLSIVYTYLINAVCQRVHLPYTYQDTPQRVGVQQVSDMCWILGCLWLLVRLPGTYATHAHGDLGL
jgi:hypothetical protein